MWDKAFTKGRRLPEGGVYSKKFGASSYKPQEFIDIGKQFKNRKNLIKIINKFLSIF